MNITLTFLFALVLSTANIQTPSSETRAEDDLFDLENLDLSNIDYCSPQAIVLNEWVENGQERAQVQTFSGNTRTGEILKRKKCDAQDFAVVLIKHDTGALIAIEGSNYQ